MTVLSEKKIKESVGGSLLCRAIYLMEKADQPEMSRSQVEKLLEKSMAAIEEAQEEEKKLVNQFAGPAGVVVKDIVIGGGDLGFDYRSGKIGRSVAKGLPSL